MKKDGKYPNCEMKRKKMENIQIAKWNLGIIEKVQIERYNPKLKKSFAGKLLSTHIAFMFLPCPL